AAGAAALLLVAIGAGAKFSAVAGDHAHDLALAELPRLLHARAGRRRNVGIAALPLRGPRRGARQLLLEKRVDRTRLACGEQVALAARLAARGRRGRSRARLSGARPRPGRGRLSLRLGSRATRRSLGHGGLRLRRLLALRLRLGLGFRGLLRAGHRGAALALAGLLLFRSATAAACTRGDRFA